MFVFRKLDLTPRPFHRPFHQARMNDTEALDDILVQQAHDEALIEFEYQRREEAEVQD